MHGRESTLQEGIAIALDFDGVDDIVDHGDVAGIDGAAAFTFMWWQMPDAAVAADGIVGKGSGTGCMCRHEGSVATTIQIYINSVAHTRASAFSDGVWAHHCVVFNGAEAGNDRLKYYRNGVQEALTYGGTPPATLPDMGAGVWKFGGDAGWGGFADMKIACHKAWLAALSAAEVAQEVWFRRLQRTANKLIWSPYDDGTNARDYSGNSNHGTVTGAVAAAGPAISYGGRIP